MVVTLEHVAEILHKQIQHYDTVTTKVNSDLSPHFTLT